jgi:hypothetical protein
MTEIYLRFHNFLAPRAPPAPVWGNPRLNAYACARLIHDVEAAQRRQLWHACVYYPADLYAARLPCRTCGARYHRQALWGSIWRWLCSTPSAAAGPPPPPSDGADGAAPAQLLHAPQPVSYQSSAAELVAALSAVAAHELLPALPMLHEPADRDMVGRWVHAYWVHAYGCTHIGCTHIGGALAVHQDTHASASYSCWRVGCRRQLARAWGGHR